jgi:hypothetical protein
MRTSGSPGSRPKRSVVADRVDGLDQIGMAELTGKAQVEREVVGAQHDGVDPRLAGQRGHALNARGRFDLDRDQ